METPLTQLSSSHTSGAPGLSTTGRRVLALLTEALMLVLALAAVPVVVLLDTTVLGTHMSEHSLTELLQGMLIGLSALAFGWSAARISSSRGYLALVAGLFGWMFLRENDAVFDMIVHGFWQVPATAVLLTGAGIAWLHRQRVLPAFLAHAETRQSTYVFVGIILLVVFSRLFGTGSLWQGVMGDAYHPTFKSAIQEGLELMSYVLIAYGALASYLSGFGTSRQDAH
jgi:hypothetical protein